MDAGLWAGDAETFGDLLLTWGPGLHERLGERAGHRHDAGDLLTVVMLEAWRARASAPDGSPRPWLETIADDVAAHPTRPLRAHRSALDRYARRERAGGPSQPPSTAPSTAGPGLDAPELLRRREHLVTELRLATWALPTRRRRTLPRGVRLALGLSAAAALVAVTAVAMTSTGSPPPAAAPVLEVRPVSDRSVQVRVVDSAADAARMTAEVSGPGRDVVVETVPVSPQLVGMWLGAFSADVPVGVRDAVLPQPGYVEAIEVPSSFPGTITLTAGRAPRPGEPAAVLGTPNALAPGGRLACLDASGGDPGTVALQLAALGYAVALADGDDPTTPALTSPGTGRRVLTATIADEAPRIVRLILGRPAGPGYSTRVRTGWSPAQWSARPSPPTPAPPPLPRDQGSLPGSLWTQLTSPGPARQTSLITGEWVG